MAMEPCVCRDTGLRLIGRKNPATTVNWKGARLSYLKRWPARIRLLRVHQVPVFVQVKEQGVMVEHTAVNVDGVIVNKKAAT